MPSLTPLPFYLVNAFATSPHGGNQAAVVVFPAHHEAAATNDTRAKNEKYLQAVAVDFNLPMTSFLVPLPDHAEGEPTYSIRWIAGFGKDSKICGHGTLAAATVVLNRLHPTATVCHFISLTAGHLTARLHSRGQPSAISLELPMPAAPVTPATGQEATAIAQAFAARSAAGFDATADIVAVNTFVNENGHCVLVELSPDVDVAALKQVTARLTPRQQFMTLVTQLVGPSEDGSGSVRINSRVFKAEMPTAEDPVTGSAHAVLAEYFLTGAASGKVKPLVEGETAKATLDAHQLSERGGAMKTRIVGGGKAEVVGESWVVGAGTLEVL